MVVGIAGDLAFALSFGRSNTESPDFSPFVGIAGVRPPALDRSFQWRMEVQVTHTFSQAVHESIAVAANAAAAAVEAKEAAEAAAEIAQQAALSAAEAETNVVEAWKRAETTCDAALDAAREALVAAQAAKEAAFMLGVHMRFLHDTASAALVNLPRWPG